MSNEYKTTDLALAAALSLAFGVERIDRFDNDKKVTFVFKNDLKLQSTLTQYWAHKLKIEPIAYFQEIKSLKGRIYGQPQS